MPAPHHGKDGSIKVGAGGAGATNLVAMVYEWEFNPTAPVADGTPMRAPAGRFKGGIKSATGKISCRYDPEDTDGQVFLEAGVEFDFELLPLAETSGNPTITGRGIVTSAPLTGSYQEMIDQQFEFQVDDDWTYGTVTP